MTIKISQPKNTEKIPPPYLNMSLLNELAYTMRFIVSITNSMFKEWRGKNNKI